MMFMAFHTSPQRRRALVTMFAGLLTVGIAVALVLG